MGPRRFPQPYGKWAIIFGIAAAAIYLLMMTVTLAHLEAVSGLPPFDMRPSGYGPGEAAALLDALGGEGRGYYLTRQIPLDTLYPPLLALTLVATMLWLDRHAASRAALRVGVALSIGVALFDYAENLGIVAMILSWPDPPAALVQAASSASVVKSALTIAAVATLVPLSLLSLRRLRRSGAGQRG